jgi:hypothetical protein
MQRRKGLEPPAAKLWLLSHFGVAMGRADRDAWRESGEPELGHAWYGPLKTVERLHDGGMVAPIGFFDQAGGNETIDDSVAVTVGTVTAVKLLHVWPPMFR